MSVQQDSAHGTEVHLAREMLVFVVAMIGARIFVLTGIAAMA